MIIWILSFPKTSRWIEVVEAAKVENEKILRENLKKIFIFKLQKHYIPQKKA